MVMSHVCMYTPMLTCASAIEANDETNQLQARRGTKEGTFILWFPLVHLLIFCSWSSRVLLLEMGIRTLL